MPTPKGYPKNLGFTLVELLIVIAIIAILVTMVVMIIDPVRRIWHARNVVRVNDLGTIVRVLEVYNVENGTYPEEHWYDTSRGCTTTKPGGNWWEDARFNNNDWSGGDCPAGETLDSQVSPDLLPKDPINEGYYTYRYAADAKGGGTYVAYKLTTRLEGRTPPRYNICGGDWQGSWFEADCLTPNPTP